MRVILLSVGETKPLYLKEGEAVYAKRLRQYCRIEYRSVPGETLLRSAPAGLVLRKEADRLLASVPEKGVAVAMDRSGVLWSSETLSRRIADWQLRGIPALTFIIGGPIGLHSSVLAATDAVLSLSPMTFNHDMVRLILLEQLYRSFSMMRGEKYHK